MRIKRECGCTAIASSNHIALGRALMACRCGRRWVTMLAPIERKLLDANKVEEVELEHAQ